MDFARRGPAMGRPSSLPPLTPLGTGVSEATVLMPCTLRRTRFSSERLWATQYQLQPLQKTWRAGASTSDLFRCPSLPPAAGSRQASFATRSLDSRDRSATESGSAGEQKVLQPRPPRRRHRDAHVRTIKAVYMSGDGNVGVREDEADIDALLDSAGSTGLEAASAAEAKLRREVAALHTGEDAIKFFTRHGGTSEVKVLYFNRPPEADSETGGGAAPTGPYDLVLVPRERVQPEHFTISANGVVHFRPGQLSECTPLSEWMHQSLMHRVLRSMLFFRLFPQRKALTQWRESARYASYGRRRQQVARKCFFVKPAFVASVLRARNLVHEAGQVPLVRLPEQCCQLADFAELQRSLLSHPVDGVQRRLESRHDALVQLLERLATSVERTADGRPGPLAAAVQPGRAAASRSKSMGQEKQEAREQARRWQVAQLDRELLPDCLRLVDCMLQAELAAAALAAAQELRRRVEVASGQARGALFTVSAAFAPGGDVVLEPPKECFAEALLSLWQGVLAAVEAVPALFSARPLLRHSPQPQGRQAAGQVLASSRAWLECTEQAAVGLAAQVASVAEYAREAYEPYHRIRQFGLEWDEACFLRGGHTREALAESMGLMQRFQEDLGRFRTQRVMGVVLLDGRALRDSLEPVPRDGLSTMKRAAAALASEKYAAACKRFDLLLKALDERPREAAAFANFVRLYEDACDEQDQWPEVVEDVREVHFLRRRYGARISVDEQLQIESLQERAQALARTALPEAAAFIAQRRASSAPRLSPEVTDEGLISVSVSGGVGLAGEELERLEGEEDATLFRTAVAEQPLL